MKRTERVMLLLGCDEADAQRYIELRDEGYSQHTAAVLAGISDPYVETEDAAEHSVTAEEEEAFNSMRGELR